MYDTTIAAKLLGQLESFLGRISPHFHKPVARFIGDMVYGIMIEKDVKLSSIVRALKERTTPKQVEDRLSRMFSSDGLEARLHGRGLRKRGGQKQRRTTPTRIAARARPFRRKLRSWKKTAPSTNVIATENRLMRDPAAMETSGIASPWK